MVEGVTGSDGLDGLDGLEGSRVFIFFGGSLERKWLLGMGRDGSGRL